MMAEPHKTMEQWGVRWLTTNPIDFLIQANSVSLTNIFILSKRAHYASITEIFITARAGKVASFVGWLHLSHLVRLLENHAK